MTASKLAFIGGGNMAHSLVGGLIADGWKPENIRIAEPDPARAASLSKNFGVQVSSVNSEAITMADAVVLAIKPQVIRQVAKELAEPVMKQQPLIISIAAGVRESALRRWLGNDAAIVRAMPNTPALVQAGATALYANPHVSTAQHDLAESVLRAVGLTIWVEDEALMDVVTAVSGSGPAYFFLFMEALQAAGKTAGLTEQDARLLVLQTALGAAKMAMESTEDAATLCQRVISPGGTTERAMEIFRQHNFEDIIQKAVAGAVQRSKELAEQFGKD